MTDRNNEGKINKGLEGTEEKLLRNIAIGGEDAQVTRTSEDIDKEKPDEVDESDSEGQGTGNASGSTGGEEA